MDVQGHRGARGYLPENTLPAFAKGLEFGVDTLELDCGVTRDGVVVVHHDRRLNPDIARGPDGRWVEAPAPTITSLTFDELQRYDVGRLRPGSEYAKRFPHQKPIDGTRIPRLANLFSLVKDKGNSTVRFNIEPKSDLEAPQDTLPPEPFARALLAEIRKAGLEKRTTVQAFDWRSLKVVEREAPEMQTVYCTEGEGSDPARVHGAGGKIWSPNFAELSERKLAEARRFKMKITVWTVNEPADIARMIDVGVDGMASDYPDRVIEMLKKRGKR
jgi:glycerophosphoryl diester phosphodiesterase